MGHFGGKGERMSFSKFLRMAAVCDALGVSRATLYRMVRDGHFPRPVMVTANVRAWPADMVAAWMHEKVKQSSQP